MAQVLHGLHELWRDHAGARWLIPMLAGLAITAMAIWYLIASPHA